MHSKCNACQKGERVVGDDHGGYWCIVTHVTHVECIYLLMERVP